MRHLIERWFQQVCAAIHPEGDHPYWLVEPVDVMANKRPPRGNPLRAVTKRLQRIEQSVDGIKSTGPGRRDRNRQRDKIIRRLSEQHRDKSYRELANLAENEPEIRQLDVRISKDIVRTAIKGARGKPR